MSLSSVFESACQTEVTDRGSFIYSWDDKHIHHVDTSWIGTIGCCNK
jgi:hypothetical protein